MTKEYYKAQIGNLEVITEFSIGGLMQLQTIAAALGFENFTTKVVRRKVK